MRKFYISFLTAFSFLLIANSITAQTFTGANFDVPTGAPGTTTGPASGTVLVSGVGVVANGANITVRVQMNHTFNGDLALWLVGPGGQTLELSTRNGGGNNNMDVTFSDAGAAFITAAVPATSTAVGGCPPASLAFSGTHKPEGRNNVIPAFPTSPSDVPAPGTFTFANTYSGVNANGTWTLHINDHVGGDVGATCIWSIIFPAAAVPCAENFDGVSAPNLPPMWTTVATGVEVPWVTSTTTPFSAPNCAFAPDVSNIGTSTLTSRVLQITSASAVLSFRNLYNLEDNFDGMVLEISIGGGAFQDILAAGGTFGVGGYNDVISTAFGSPIGGRLAWNGLSAGTTAAPAYILTTVNLPASANGQNVVLRWIVATDNSVVAGGANGARIDDISVTGSNCGGDCSGTPTAGAITGPATACNGNSVTLTLSGHTTLPGIAIQWKSSNVSGGPYTNIAGATTATYTFSAAPGTTYYIATVTCTAGGASANTAQHTLVVGNPTHSAVSATVTTLCSPGSATITGTVSGGVTFNPQVLGNSGTINMVIPDANPTGASSVINLSASTLPAATDLKIRINARHTWVGDLRFTLTTPCGTTLLFDRPGVPASGFGNSDNLGTSSAAPPPPAVYTFDVAAATVIPEASVGGFVPAGSYQPSDAGGAAHNWTGLTFPCTAAGNWTLNIVDNAGGDVGDLIDWQILGPPTYTHTLTGPGTITQNPPTGANNGTANFTITNIPFGNQTYILTSTDAIGCSVNSSVPVLIKQTPVISFVQTPVNPICNGQIQQITASVVPPVLQTFTQIANTQVPAGQPTTSTGPADPYSSNIVVSGIPTSGPTVKSVRLGNINHSFPDDIDVVLVSPGGTSVILMSDAGGGTDAVGIDYVLDDAAAGLLADATLSPAGTYKPTNYGVPDPFVAPGPGSLSQATPLISSFGAANHNGTWRLYVVDDAGGDVGYIGNWSITFNIPPTVVFSPTTNLYTDAAATIPYTGTPITVVYAKPSTTTTYTANTTVDGCSGSNTVTVTVNQLPTITVQPAPATQTVCAGFNVTYTVTATGTGITYQWRKDGVNLVNNAQISGVTTNSLTITGVTSANSGSYTVVVSGACLPAVTSNAAVLNVATTPVISTQPASQTRCIGQNAVFTVANAGSVPPPTIFQWQVSTDAGVTWTNLLTGGSFTNTLTVPNVQTTDNNKRYRVIVTNSCGQTVTSSAATLTVTANPVVTVNTLPRICISDSLVTLVGTPVGGNWTGIGVSGFNFVPAATAIGTFTLTYTYTSATGCTATATTIAKVEDCPERLRLLRDNAAIVYPNPNTGQFNIKMNSTLYNYLGMRVYTTAGQQVHVQTWGGLVYGRVIPVDLTFLPSGTYMVKLYYDDGVRSSEKTFPVVIGRN